VDRLARCYFQAENKWYNSRIESIDIENQEAEVIFIGFKDKIPMHAVFIKLLPIYDPSLFEAGAWCEAIYSGDGNFYPCVIEKVTETGYQVKFRKYNNKETISLNHMRPLENSDSSAKVKKMIERGDVKELKIPDYLKILPNDSEAQRKSKKKKVKGLKQAFKIAQIEKDSNDKKGKWVNFNTKGYDAKKGLFKKNESIFKSPETIEGKVGVMGSGKGMTNFSQRTKFTVGDSSHLSQMF